MSAYREYNNFRFEISYYSFDFDYSTETDCGAYGCDSICRCSKIIDPVVEKTSNITSGIVQIEKISAKSKRKNWHSYVPTKIEAYCIDRLFRSYKLYDSTDYIVRVSNGYYGEEIVGIDHANFSDFFNDLHTMLNFTNDIDKIKLILTREYAFLLPEIETCSSATICSRNIKQLVNTGSTKDRLMGVKSSQYFSYEYQVDGDTPIGVILGARLIDGHHRICAALKTVQENFNFIEIS